MSQKGPSEDEVNDAFRRHIVEALKDNHPAHLQLEPDQLHGGTVVTK